jgi:NADPH-dependent curcumin reductase CurA
MTLTFSWRNNLGRMSCSSCNSRSVTHYVIAYANDRRFSICGAISQYNSRKPVGPRNFNNIIAQRITVRGFIILDYEKRFTAAQREIAGWLKSGKLKRQEWIVEGGIEKAEEGLRGLFEGKNLGKCLIKVGKEKSRL